jgi:ketosteroid isomerase-like protein
VPNGKGQTPTEKNTAIEREILRVHTEMMEAAENLDADKLFSHVCDMNEGVIIQDGRILMTRQEALNSTKQDFQGLKGVSYNYDHKHITVISPTAVLWVADGTTSASFMGDGGEVSIAFSETIVFAKKDGEWKVFHAHRSIPNSQ